MSRKNKALILDTLDQIIDHADYLGDKMEELQTRFKFMRERLA
jgi:hypothetical protein